VIASPGGLRIEFTIVAVLLAWLTGLPPLRLVRRNLVLGAATLSAGIVIGLVSGGESR
jgi:hypothetical protein